MTPRSRTIGGATIYLGDCREILPSLPERAAMLCTDPPYRVTSGGKASIGPGPFGGWLREYDNKGGIVADCAWADWLPLIPGALADAAHAYIFTNDRNLGEARTHAEAAGLKFHRLLVWDKRSAVPNRWYQQTCEFVLFMRQGAAFRINDPSSKTLVSMFQHDESGTSSTAAHRTEKPVELCAHYIKNSTKPGDLVLDPFLGSGTTAVAAIRSGRRFVGCELTEEWFEVACRRIEAAAYQPSLFDAEEVER